MMHGGFTICSCGQSKIQRLFQMVEANQALRLSIV